MTDTPIVDSRRSCDDYVTNTMSSKPLKVFPQSFLEKQYDFVVWYDNKFSVNVDDTIRVINSWNDAHALMLHRHPFLRNVKEEFIESMKQPRYFLERRKYIRYINECEEEGLVDNYALHSQCGYIIYNLNHSMTSEIQTGWISHIHKCGVQDQISFNMFRQKYEEYIGEYKYDIESPVRSRVPPRGARPRGARPHGVRPLAVMRNFFN